MFGNKDVSVGRPKKLVSTAVVSAVLLASLPIAMAYAADPAAAAVPDLATKPVDGTGAPINLNQNADEAANSLNCTLSVPNDPLTAAGLATPWVLGDGCTMANADLRPFVEATILDPTGGLQVYNPLVITAGTTAAAPTMMPSITAGSGVVINVGFNGTNLVLTGAGATTGNCIDALGQSVFGQVAACNSTAFFDMANAEIAQGTLKIPALGTANDGQACPTTRDFGVIDQDQSDNVNSVYLLTPAGKTAQNTIANAGDLLGSTTVANGSDNALLAKFVDRALDCVPMVAPSVTSLSGSAPSQTLNELSAAANQQGTIALVPPNDPMTLVNGNFSLAKTNAYRALIGQTALAAGTDLNQEAATYCQNMVNMAPTRLQLDATMDAKIGSPVADVGNNLANFLGNRLSMSFTNLNCGDFGLKDPTKVKLDGNQVAIGVTYNTTQQKAVVKAAANNATTTTQPADDNATTTTVANDDNTTTTVANDDNTTTTVANDDTTSTTAPDDNANFKSSAVTTTTTMRTMR